jgi:hypothetical protein
MGKTTSQIKKRDLNKHLPAAVAENFVVTDAPGVAFTDKELGHVDLSVMTEKKADALIKAGVKWLSRKPNPDKK